MGVQALRFPADSKVSLRSKPKVRLAGVLFEVLPRGLGFRTLGELKGLGSKYLIITYSAE